MSLSLILYVCLFVCLCNQCTVSTLSVQHTGCTIIICTLCTSSVILQGTMLIQLSMISPNNMGCESHHSNHWRQMCVFVSLCYCLSFCVCLFVYEIVLVHYVFVCLSNCNIVLCVCGREFVKVCCVYGRECNNCLRLIPECDELSVPVKYLPHSHTLCVCCAVLLYTVFAVPCHCTLSLL